ncbi:MAG: hypothetical protein LAN37_07140 [Acidobacteriia bacterium]|nr:hypothetical protein [Terriglobia bacterium]
MTNEERQSLTRLVEALFLEVVSLQTVLIQDHAASDWEIRRNAILGDRQMRTATRERFRTVYEGITAGVDDSHFLELLSTMRATTRVEGIVS